MCFYHNILIKMEIIKAIAVFYVWWDCPKCGHSNKNDVCRPQLDIDYHEQDTKDWGRYKLKEQITRKCEKCGNEVAIQSITH